MVGLSEDRYESLFISFNIPFQRNSDLILNRCLIGIFLEGLGGEMFQSVAKKGFWSIHA